MTINTTAIVYNILFLSVCVVQRRPARACASQEQNSELVVGSGGDGDGHSVDHADHALDVGDKFGHEGLLASFLALPLIVTTPSAVVTRVLSALVEW